MFRSATTGKHIPAEGIPVIVIVRSDPSWSWRSLEDVMDSWAPGVRNRYQLMVKIKLGWEWDPKLSPSLTAGDYWQMDVVNGSKWLKSKNPWF